MDPSDRLTEIGRVAAAFDLSGPRAAVALALDGVAVEGMDLGPRKEHSARLLPAIARLLEKQGMRPDRLTDVVVGEGPGSFTGVRVAAATAKGLARSTGSRLWAVSSLAAAALDSGSLGDRYVLFDAGAERIYGACHRVGPSGVTELVPPHAGELRELLEASPPSGAIFVGSGAIRHSELIARHGFDVEEFPASRPSPDGLLRFLQLEQITEPVADPGSWEPRYLRPWRPG